ncbi:hypothetical protein [Trujillonella endophytica]|uniref:Uncharacterized protein n=1 Tax=Trujillonella endophytica TaxID=673521 RepID=A0A1H8QN67_9ACTN|nr:hypothetical protein [Trujillella endophytica]SEO55334.1 hypothetical protein SAMN05660991_00687 [Trujillella endophytica]
MHIDWATLTEVAVVAAAAALTVVLLVSSALVGLSARVQQGDPTVQDGHGDGARAGTVVAVLCVAAGALIVGYGLYLIVA